MNTVEQIQQRLTHQFPDAEINIRDYRHDGMHVVVEISSSAFNGLTLIKQHQLVYQAVNDLIKSGEVHAFKLKTIPKN